jgi:hypothetical protein
MQSVPQAKSVVEEKRSSLVLLTLRLACHPDLRHAHFWPGQSHSGNADVAVRQCLLPPVRGWLYCSRIVRQGRKCSLRSGVGYGLWASAVAVLFENASNDVGLQLD